MDLNIPGFVSPEMKAVLENWIPYWLQAGFCGMPAKDDIACWQAQDEAKRAVAIKVGENILEEYGASIEERYLRDIRVLDIKPQQWRHKDQVLVHTHGGGFYAHSPSQVIVIPPWRTRIRSSVSICGKNIR